MYSRWISEWLHLNLNSQELVCCFIRYLQSYFQTSENILYFVCISRKINIRQFTFEQQFLQNREADDSCIVFSQYPSFLKNKHSQ